MRYNIWESDGSDRKIEKQVFLWCSTNYAGGEVLACYEREKAILRIVIKIHKLGIVGGF